LFRLTSPSQKAISVGLFGFQDRDIIDRPLSCLNLKFKHIFNFKDISMAIKLLAK
jgi:hypothetical protein